MSDMEDEDQRGEKSRRKNPFDAASAVSKIIYSWGTYYLREGNKRELTEDDICEPMGCHKSILSEKNMSKAWDEEVHECKRKNRRPNLLKAIVRTYGSKFVVLFLLTVIQETIPFILIYFLNGLLQYFANPSDDPQLYRYALIDAFAVFFTIFMRSFLIHFILLQTSFMGMDIRVAVSTLLYQKVLRVSKAKKAIKSTGFIINLFANDGTKLERLFTFASLVIISPIQCVAASIVSWYIMGWPAAVAAFFSLACYPLQMWTGMSCAKARLEVAKKTDVRVRIMNEIISGIKVLKMYAWEESFSRLISAARWEEIKCLEKAIRIRYFGLMNIVYRTRTALFLLILLYVLYVGDISPVSLYVTSALLYLYQATLSVTFTKGCLFSKEAFLSLERITEFLLSAEHGDQDGQTETNPGNTDEENIPSSCLEVNGVESDQVISIKGMSAGWSAAQSTLSDVNLDFPRGELTAVVGAVGAGKADVSVYLYSIMRANKKENHW